LNPEVGVDVAPKNFDGGKSGHSFGGRGRPVGSGKKPKLTEEEKKENQAKKREEAKFRRKIKQFTSESKASLKKNVAEKSEQEHLLDAVQFDSPALAAVKRMFNQLKRDTKKQEQVKNRLHADEHMHVDDGGANDQGVDLFENNNSQQANEQQFMARQDIQNLQKMIVEHT
jgi:hypothetical protein